MNPPTQPAPKRTPCPRCHYVDAVWWCRWCEIDKNNWQEIPRVAIAMHQREQEPIGVAAGTLALAVVGTGLMLVVGGLI